MATASPRAQRTKQPVRTKRAAGTLSPLDQRAFEGFRHLSDDSLISIRVMCSVAGFGESTAWRHLQHQTPGFPAPIRCGVRITRFRVGDIRRYLADLAGAA